MRPRLIQGPDDAVRLWWRLTAREETAGGRDPFLIKGSVPAKRCTACGDDRHHEVPAKRGHGWVERCQRCGALWQSEIELVPRGAVQATRHPHGLERRLVNLADLEICIEAIPKADSLPYGLYLFTDRSWEYVAALANQKVAEHPGRWPARAGGFTLDRVRGSVKRARSALRRALEHRALLARQVPVLLLTGDRALIEALMPLPVEVVVPADPSRWSGLLHDFEHDAVARAPITAAPYSWIKLSRGSAPDIGTVYRQVPV